MNVILRWWTLFAVVAAMAMLGAAHAFETWGGLAPCHLCLKAREVYWASLVISVPASLWALGSRSKATPRVAAFLLFAVFFAGAVTAGFHAGGEARLWSLPASCSSAGGGVIDLAAMEAFNGGAVSRAPKCDVAAWSWLGVSMAGWNGIVSLVLMVLSLLAAKRPREARAPRPVPS